VRSPLGDDDGAAYHRGRLIHRLLQSLPDLPADSRRAAAERFLASPAHGLDAAQQAQIAEETLAVLENPDFAALFGPGSAAEVPVVGVLAGEHGPEAVTGRIDRLLVTDEAVVVVDFKTNRPPPRTPAEVPQVYRAQLRGYRRLLESVYPGRRVETWLLWTDGPDMMQISDA
jgi:ATP-dependent helicase/nuclease subunit A